MKVAIIGAGCVGVVIASRLIDFTESEVAFIATGARAVSLRDNGIIVNGRRYAVPIAQESFIPDLIIVCVKNYHLESACVDLHPFVGIDTIVLPLLNSINPTEVLASRYPNNEVLYGYMSKIDSHKEAAGFAYNVAGDIHLGHSRNDPPCQSVLSVVALLSQAGFSAQADTDMLRGIWKKWMLNVGANQISALTGADYLQFARIPEIKVLLRMAMTEILEIAVLEDIDLTRSDMDEMIEYLMTYEFPKKTSMLQDVEAGRKTEIDYICGQILVLSNKWQHPCPVNRTLYNLIKAKEKVYLGEED